MAAPARVPGPRVEPRRIAGAPMEGLSWLCESRLGVFGFDLDAVLAGIEELDVVSDDVVALAGLVLVVLPDVVLEATGHGDAAALLEVLVGDLGELVPGHDVDEDRACVVPAAALHGEAQLADVLAGLGL